MEDTRDLTAHPSGSLGQAPPVSVAAKVSCPGGPLGCALCCVHRVWRGRRHATRPLPFSLGPHRSAVCPRQKLGFEYVVGALGLGYLLSLCSFTFRTHNAGLPGPRRLPEGSK